MAEKSGNLFARCGLYCGNCILYVERKECDGCGCNCGNCRASHCAQSCKIFPCTEDKKLTSCADCAEFPCTQLIQFCYDPIWRSHLPVIENLRRVKKIGVQKWLAEQAAYWSDQRRLAQWLEMHSKCMQAYQEFEIRKK